MNDKYQGESKNITASKYRALYLSGDIKNRISTQGTFIGVDELKGYLIKRGLDDGAVMRVEREHNGKWLFVQNIVIPNSVISK